MNPELAVLIVPGVVGGLVALVTAVVTVVIKNADPSVRAQAKRDSMDMLTAYTTRLEKRMGEIEAQNLGLHAANDALQTKVAGLIATQQEKDRRIVALEAAVKDRNAREAERVTELEQVRSYVSVLEAHVGVLTQRLQEAGIEVPPMPEVPPLPKPRTKSRRRKGAN